MFWKSKYIKELEAKLVAKENEIEQLKVAFSKKIDSYREDLAIHYRRTERLEIKEENYKKQITSLHAAIGRLKRKLNNGE